MGDFSLGSWKPKYGESYYYIGLVLYGGLSSNYGKLEVFHSEWSSLEFESGLLSQGNYFRTREEAERKLDVILGVLR